MDDQEVRRQQALIAAIGGAPPIGLRETGARAARGLEAYRAHAEASAERELRAAFPTVQALLGDELFARLAREFWHAQPPLRGDLGEWGDGVAAWLQAHPGLTPWPYLADCARLDLACHRIERAADAALDAASLSRLESADPAQLRLVLMPGAALVRSRWPIVAIRQAHQLTGDDAERAFDELRGAIALPQGEDALVARDGWRAVVHALSPSEAAWTELVLGDTDLATALERVGPGFDFAHWLQRAIRHQWLSAVARTSSSREA